jgi:hypothetical protein
MVRALSGLLPMAQDPQDAKVLTALILMNVEGEGLGDVNNYYRKQLVSMGVIEPNEEERAEMEAAAQAQGQPDPNAVYLAAAAEKEQALAGKAQADTELAMANADKARADTAKTMAELGTQMGA